MLMVLLALCASGFAAGCESTSVILVPTAVDVDGVPYTVLRLADPIQARVFVERGGETIRSENWVELPAGWLLIPPHPTGNEK